MPATCPPFLVLSSLLFLVPRSRPDLASLRVSSLPTIARKKATTIRPRDFIANWGRSKVGRHRELVRDAFNLFFRSRMDRVKLALALELGERWWWWWSESVKK